MVVSYMLPELAISVPVESTRRRLKKKKRIRNGLRIGFIELKLSLLNEFEVEFYFFFIENCKVIMFLLVKNGSLV